MLHAAREAERREKSNRAAVKRQPSIYNTYNEQNRMASSVIASAEEVTNSAGDSLGILALETVENKSVDYEYNELKGYLIIRTQLILTRLFSEMRYITAQMGTGSFVYEYLIPYDSREGPRHNEAS